MTIKNKIFNRADAGTTILIIIGILAVVNFLSYQIFHRWDLTRNKDYTISDSTKKSISKLDDIVNIKAYFSKNLPTEIINLPQEVGDILDEYQTYSNGNVKYQVIEPKDDDQTMNDLYLQGIPQIQFNIVEKDKVQLAKGYMGIVISQGENKQSIPVVQDTKNLEYQITLAIKKVSSKQLASVGFITSNGCSNTTSTIKTAYQKLQDEYDTTLVDLTKQKEIPQNIKTLIIIGPREKFKEDQLKIIDTFLTNGGSLLVLLDSVNVGNDLVATTVETGLEILIEKYGLRINKDLILDIYNDRVSFSLNQGIMSFSTSYPFWPKIINSGFDKDNSAVAKLETLVLPWASSMDILKDIVDKTATVSYLAKSSNKAWRQTSNFDLSPQQNFLVNGKDQYNLAISIRGKLISPYTKKFSDQSRLIIVGDSNFIEDLFLRNNPDNLIFFQNIVDSLTLDENLISIRSKGITETPIKELSDTSTTAIRYINIFGLTGVVLILGLARYFLRRRSKFVDEL